jgi:hypothetical protein
MIWRLWHVLTAAGILAAAAVAHGWRTDRWGASPDLAEAAVRLDAIPLQVGDWTAMVDELPAEQIKVARVAGLKVLRFSHRYTQDEVTVLILAGRPGPIAVHTPDVCYRGAGFVPGPSRAEPLSDGSTAWVADFKKGGAQPETLRIRWAWSTGSGWIASGSPRLEFARAPVLYKMYFVRQVPPGGDPHDKLPELSLANEFLPVVQSALAGSR